MPTERDFYRLAQQVRGDRSRDGLTKLATVASVSPFAIKIGTAVYSSKDWVMYTPDADCDIKGERTFLSSASHCQCGDSISAPDIDIKKAKLTYLYEVGQLLAVVEISDGNGFIILGKLRRL